MTMVESTVDYENVDGVTSESLQPSSVQNTSENEDEDEDEHAELPCLVKIFCGRCDGEYLRFVLQKDLAPVYTACALMSGMGAIVLSFFGKHWHMVLGFILAGISTVFSCFLSVVSSYRTDTLELKVDRGFAKMDRGFAKMDAKMDTLEVKLDTFEVKLDTILLKIGGTTPASTGGV